MNQVPIALLKPHPKNKEFFPDALPENLWRELVEDIRENGIINPLIVTPDYTVLAGHLRLEAAKEAGLTHVSVIIRDVAPDSEEAVGLLVKDNLLRRQLSDMQVARLIRVLKEQYGVKRGNNQYLGGASAKIAEAIGISERRLREINKLNALIDVVNKGDQTLYRAKEDGRNKVEAVGAAPAAENISEAACILALKAEEVSTLAPEAATMQTLVKYLILEVLRGDYTKRMIVIENDKDLEIYQAKKKESALRGSLPLKQDK